MGDVSVNLDTQNKGYLDEKELFILFHLLQHKSVSTMWSSVFTPNNQSVFIPRNVDADEGLTELEKEVQRTIERRQSKKQSSVVLAYLLGLGKELDEKRFSVYCNADYALVEGGFLCEYVGTVMHEYLRDTDENRKKDDKYKVLNEEQLSFLKKAIADKDFDRVQLSTLEHPPIREYQEAILNKKADEDFIELVNKLVTDYDGGKWDTEDARKFLEIYYRHNKQGFKQNALTEKTAFYEDWQTKLAGIIFEHIDIYLQISDTKKLEKYLDEYIELFRKDQLNGKSNLGLSRTFFSTGLSVPLHTKLFGYKRQREILIEHIEEKYAQYQRTDLDIGSPYVAPEYIGDIDNDTFQLTVADKNGEQELFRFVHTTISLFYEDYLEIEDFSYGTTQLFDLYDRGFLFKVKLKKNTEAVSTIAPKTAKSKPFLITEKRKGYLKFTKNGERIFIGNVDTRKFRLLKALMEPTDAIGTARNTDTVFEAISLPKDKDNAKLKDNYLKKNEQVSIIEYTIKELQKVRRLQGKLHFLFGDNKKNLWLETS